MLEITVPEDEVYFPKQNRLISVPACSLTLEHSLISISKWESKWHVSYLSTKDKSHEQNLDYIRCMTVGPIKNDYVFSILTPENLSQIRDYVDDEMTAAIFPPSPKSNSKEIITSETIYYRMIANNIPMECQKWHLNRLIALIRFCDDKNGEKKKMTPQQTAAYYAEQNAIRRAKYNTKG